MVTARCIRSRAGVVAVLLLSMVAAGCGDDGSGQIVVQVRNDTLVSVAGVRTQFQYVDAGGTQRQRTQNFSGQLAPGKIASANTGLVSSPGTRCAISVTAAEIDE